MAGVPPSSAVSVSDVAVTSSASVFAPVSSGVGSSAPALCTDSSTLSSSSSVSTSVVSTPSLTSSGPTAPAQTGSSSNSVPARAKSFASVAKTAALPPKEIFSFPVSVDRPNTLVVRVPPTYYAKSGFTRPRFLSILFKLVKPASVSAVQLCPGCNFRVTFKPNFAAEQQRLLLHGLSSEDGVYFPVFEAELKASRVTVTKMPVEVPDAVIRSAFANFGTVTGLTREVYASHPTILTGTIFLTIQISKAIPAVLRFADFQVAVSYRGQPRQCRICTRSGHAAGRCPMRGLCSRCGAKGHTLASCKASLLPPPSQAPAPPSAPAPATSAPVSTSAPSLDVEFADAPQDDPVPWDDLVGDLPAVRPEDISFDPNPPPTTAGFANPPAGPPLPNPAPSTNVVFATPTTPSGLVLPSVVSPQPTLLSNPVLPNPLPPHLIPVSRPIPNFYVGPPNTPGALAAYHHAPASLLNLVQNMSQPPLVLSQEDLAADPLPTQPTPPATPHPTPSPSPSLLCHHAPVVSQQTPSQTPPPLLTRDGFLAPQPPRRTRVQPPPPSSGSASGTPYEFSHGRSHGQSHGKPHAVASRDRSRSPPPASHHGNKFSVLADLEDST